ncbi:transcription factor bHLH94-like [Oryza brachyantha]|uniref:BHLH domain-containing protein n=1 Tax=Oryza brachyantha TaxID=4533 RepID=J3MYB7_ORYBR|nr:transcription factor bHLH94-like [Oryza brachyantha]
MALEAVLHSRGLFGRRCAMEGGGGVGGGGGGGGGGWSGGLFGGFEGVMDLDGGNWDAAACSSMLLHGFQELEIPVAAAVAPAPPGEHAVVVAAAGCAENAGGIGGGHQEDQATAVQARRRKRRRARAAKNREEVESQRMTHIAVERNRRKQMNEYLAVLRGLMPPSYAQRGDQASIVGGAINFVKELEQLLQSLEARKSSRQCAARDAAAPFAGFFTFPQYSMSATVAAPAVNDDVRDDGGASAEAEASGSKPSAVADVEVTMVESHANLRVLSRRRPRQLLRLVVALQGHRLTVLHLNMTSAGHMVLYSFSLKVEDDCQHTSVDEIATAVHQIIEKIQEEQGCSLD